MKLFHKIAVTTLGLAMATAVGAGVVRRNRVDMRAAKAESETIMTFDFEDETAHRTSGGNSYAATGNSYSENGTAIVTTYGDVITTGSPISGSANYLGRIAKNGLTSPTLVIGGIDFSDYKITGFSYKSKGSGKVKVTAQYSTNGTSWTDGETHSDKTTVATYSSGELSIVNPSSFYLKFVMESSDGETTTGNRDTQIDDIAIVGESTSTAKLTKIECANQNMAVTGSLDLASKVTFTPANAANKHISFSAKSGGTLIDLNTDTGAILAKKSGTAVVTITPEDTSGGATAIDVSISISALDPAEITIGNKYVIYAIDSENSYNGELTGVESNLGTVAQFAGDTPACSYVLETEDGYFENTVAFKNGTKYLSLNSAGNNLHTSDTINEKSSWIVSFDDSTNEAVIKNAAFQGRSIQMNYSSGSPRFACYTLEGQVSARLYEYVEKALTNFTISEHIDVYRNGTKQISVTYDPADAADKTLTWEVISANPAGCATVDDKGLVSGVEVGTATVRASKVISGDTVSRTCSVSVLNNAAAHKGTEADPFNIEDAVNVALGVFVENSIGEEIDLTQNYYVKGLITKTNTKTKTNLTFWVGDNLEQISVATGGFEIFKAGKVYGEDLSTYENDKAVSNDFNVGDLVLIKGKLKNYSGTPETDQGTADIIWSSYIEARKWAESFNTSIGGVCDDDGQTVASQLASAWEGVSGSYSLLESSSKAYFVAVAEGGKTTGTAVEQAVAKYDYILKKYNTVSVETYEDFMGRVDAGKITLNAPSNYINSLFSNNNNATMIIIIASSVAAISIVGAYFIIRKRKEQR